MKAYLTFNRDDPDEEISFQRAAIADKMAYFLWDYDQWMRQKYKYEDQEIYYDLRKEFHEKLDEAGINLDDIS